MGIATSQIVATSVKIERHKLDRFRQIAEFHRRTVSQQLRWLIDEAIKDDDERLEREAA